MKSIGIRIGLAAASVSLALSAALAEAGEAPKPFVNEICLPSQLWMLSDTQNDIFVKPLIKRWRPHDDFVRFALKGKQDGFFRRFSHVASVDQPTDGDCLQVDLVNGDEFETIQRIESVLRVGVRGVGEGDVYAQIVGDSYTHGAFFKQILADVKNVPKLHLVGLRRFGEPSQCHEGRGGWTLRSYFEVSKGDRTPYQGFLHPADGRYWGSRAFWKMVWRCVRKTQPKGFQPLYSCEYFDDCALRFDERTGILKDPVTGDIQYDDETKTMVRFDGAKWCPVDEKSLDWRFDYGKYLAMWNLKKPQFLFVLLGLNDFNGKLDADYSEWNRNIRTMQASYLKACPKGKFVICIPCSSCGSLDNMAGAFTVRQNAAMWRFRKWLIETFDRKESEGFYLLDTGVAIDNDNGFWVKKDGQEILPYAGYRGDEKLRVQWGNPHPYPNYATMGVPLAAFIQYWREK